MINVAIERLSPVSKNEAKKETGTFFLLKKRKKGDRIVFFLGFNPEKDLWHCIRLPGNSSDISILARLSATFYFIEKKEEDRVYVITRYFKRNAIQVYGSKKNAIKMNFKGLYRTYKDEDIAMTYRPFFKPAFIQRFVR